MPQLFLFLSSLGPTARMWPYHKDLCVLAASYGASLRGDLIYALRDILVLKCLYIVIEVKTRPSPIVTLFLIRTPLKHLLMLPSQWVLCGSFLDLFSLSLSPFLGSPPWFPLLGIPTLFPVLDSPLFGFPHLVSPSWFPSLGFPFSVSPPSLFSPSLVSPSLVSQPTHRGFLGALFLGGTYRGYCLCLEHYVTYISKVMGHSRFTLSKPPYPPPTSFFSRLTTFAPTTLRSTHVFPILTHSHLVSSS
jgi:hypothetical protein